MTYPEELAAALESLADDWLSWGSVSVAVTGTEEEPKLRIDWLSPDGRALARQELLVYTEVNPRDDRQPPGGAAAEYIEFVNTVMGQVRELP